MSVRGLSGLLVEAIKKSVEDHGKDMAAAIAFWSFFSIFPLAIAILSVAGYFLGSDEAQAKLYEFGANSFPGSATFIREQIAEVVRHRGTLGVVALLGLLWSASKGFGAVTRAVNWAAGAERPHPFFLSKARNLMTTVVCTVALLVFLAATAVVEVVLRTPLLERIGLDSTVLSRPVGVLLNLVLALLMFALLYKITSYVRVGWRDVLAGAAIAAVLFEIGKTVFVIYLERGTDFEAVYGSVSSIIVLLLWLYFSAWVLIFGAEYNIVRYREKARSSSDRSSGTEAPPA